MKLNSLFLNPIGAEISAPIPVKHHSWGAVIGGALSAVGSLLGQKQANDMNLNLNEENRTFQWRQNRLAEEFQERMWNKSNEYNSPKSQRERLQEAGYNPWMSGSGSPQSISGSAGEGKSTGAPAPIPMQDVIGPAVRTGVSTLMDASSVQANIANQNAQTVKMASEASTAYLKATGDYKGAQALAKSLLRGVNRSDKLMGDITNGINEEYLSMKLDNSLKAVEYDIKAKYGENTAKEQLNILRKQSSQLDEIINKVRSENHMTDELANKYANEAAKLLEEKNIMSESHQYLVDKVKFEKEILENDPMRSGLFSGAAKSGPVLKFLTDLLKLIMK